MTTFLLCLSYKAFWESLLSWVKSRKTTFLKLLYFYIFSDCDTKRLLIAHYFLWVMKRILFNCFRHKISDSCVDTMGLERNTCNCKLTAILWKSIFHRQIPASYSILFDKQLLFLIIRNHVEIDPLPSPPVQSLNVSNT